MKAAVLYGDEDIRYEETAEPEIKPGFVKIRVKACGICGSDIPRVLAGGAHYYPIILGHEFSGYVAEVGEGVSSLKEGDHVVGVPLIPCLKCDDCAKGYFSQCKNYSFVGSRIPGAYADYVLMPERNVVKIDEKIPFEHAAMFEPCTVSLHGVKVAKYQGGKTVAILGCGTIGLFALEWAKIFGAKKIVAFDIDPEPLATAQRVGADTVINTLEPDFMEKAMKETDGKGFDYVFETAGSVPTIKMAFELAGNKGTVGFIGTPTKEITFSKSLWENINRKELFVTGSWMSGGDAPYPGSDWADAAHYIATGDMIIDPKMVFKKFKLENAYDAFQTIKKGGIKGRVMLIND